ncbi:MBL fold metallo-hydrolase [Flavilitoribacter nigricans]|uniref:MBL fold metallo-hydrolase n=1 Tax=Flavilitoribacter nigricans (strain ATCC 23147 / DSM 23189 / NBRC 102662 / NCIMB 1420 / SS-2) TaxID=1122177 RepID=A0A2D0NBZ6_FLAN2|nr:MBL fold metallo-hydrolase [Flavilitoribacter nigricans]PHN06031.1 MBL fold metallo-hydrolase [Flavilitoribacter nigricans DSM 23189 = NBRC 102662]
MEVKRIYDEGLAHASYVVLSDGKAILIDPGRDPEPYYEYAKEKGAEIVGVIETHPHADFVSSHLEIAEDTGASIYVSRKVGADYPHVGFDEGQEIQLNGITLKALNTPGHSPDSISILLEDEAGKQQAVFTGDTLFIGDVGRPDLRENTGRMQAKRESLARQMYHSTREKLMTLNENVMVYPAHGAGSLCGKGMSDELTSTLGKQLRENPALQSMGEDEFVDWLLEGQPFIPKYFGYNVDLNKQGAPDLDESIQAVSRMGKDVPKLEAGVLIVDTRPQTEFQRGHYPGAINIMEGNKFETWLGSIIEPGEKFYLVAGDETTLDSVLNKAAKIGYEPFIKGTIIYTGALDGTESDEFDLEAFKTDPEKYTVVDIRNESEVEDGKFFEHAINIPLHELRERTAEIPTEKPIVVHCAGGYRSAAGTSIVDRAIGDEVSVFDLSEDVKEFT